MSLEYTGITILIAEDDDGHAELIREHLRSAAISNAIIRFHDGQELWDYLTVESKKPSHVNGHGFLLLLDIGMPKLDGFEVLRRINANSHWQNLSIIVLTTTDDPGEIEMCQKLGSRFQITKPMQYERLTEILTKLGLFLTIVQAPNNPAMQLRSKP